MRRFTDQLLGDLAGCLLLKAEQPRGLSAIGVTADKYERRACAIMEHIGQLAAALETLVRNNAAHSGGVDRGLEPLHALSYFSA